MSKSNRLGRNPFERPTPREAAQRPRPRRTEPAAEGILPESVHRVVIELPIRFVTLTIKAVLLGRAILVRS